MRFNPAWHDRRGLRKKQHDYTTPGSYYVTICVHDMGTFPFGDVIDGRMRLSDMGAIADEYWLRIPAHFPGVTLDAHIVMPNHVHGIIVIPDLGAKSVVGTRHASSLIPHGPVVVDSAELRDDGSCEPASGVIRRHSLRTMVGSFKSAVSKRINEIRGTPGATIWQERYHDHVIRDEESLRRIREYILSNPARWGRRRGSNRWGCRWRGEGFRGTRRASSVRAPCRHCESVGLQVAWRRV
jgi:putative transposase